MRMKKICGGGEGGMLASLLCVGSFLSDQFLSAELVFNQSGYYCLVLLLSAVALRRLSVFDTRGC